MTVSASIDIGTNSTRLLIANVSDQNVSPILYRDTITRLAFGMTSDKMLHIEGMQRVAQALNSYKKLCDQNGVQSINVMATSATREAANKDEFLTLVKNSTGLEIDVIPGETEAKLSFLGAVSDFNIESNPLVCDIGGGSTEFLFENEDSFIAKSLKIGSRRLTTKFIKNDPPSDVEIESIKNHVQTLLEENLEKPTFPLSFIGVGGTATTLAMVDQKCPLEKPEKIHKTILEKSHLDQIILNFSSKKIIERQTTPGLHPDRADVILTGSLILSTIMEYFNVSYAFISLRDLLFGRLMHNDER